MKFLTSAGGSGGIACSRRRSARPSARGRGADGRSAARCQSRRARRSRPGGLVVRWPASAAHPQPRPVLVTAGPAARPRGRWPPDGRGAWPASTGAGPTVQQGCDLRLRRSIRSERQSVGAVVPAADDPPADAHDEVRGVVEIVQVRGHLLSVSRNEGPQGLERKRRLGARAGTVHIGRRGRGLHDQRRAAAAVRNRPRDLACVAYRSCVALTRASCEAVGAAVSESLRSRQALRASGVERRAG